MTTTSSPILVSISFNELMRLRADKIKQAVAADDRFAWRFGSPDGGEEPLFDLEFNYLDDSRLNVELKDFTGDSHSDYLSSILSGHAWEQVAAARELGDPFILAVLGDDSDIQAAIRKAAGHCERGEKQEFDEFDLTKMLQYSSMVDGFEANCIGCGIQVWHLGYNQFPRLLLRVRKILEGGDLSGFCPKPSDGERAAVALSIAAGRGVGVKKAQAILEHFQLSLLPKEDVYDPLQLIDISGIGPKLAAQIRKNIEVVE